MPEVILKRFETPDEVISFEKGRFEKIRLGGVTIGRAAYEPGWKWSAHVGSKTGATLCQVEHVGLVVSGRATAAMEDGTVIEMRAGDLFYIPPGHDKVVRIDRKHFANDPSGSVEQLIDAKAVRLDAYLHSVPELLSRSGKKLRRAVKDKALASIALQRLLETGQVIEFK